MTCKSVEGFSEKYFEITDTDSIKTALIEGKYEGLTILSRFQKADKGRVGDISINGTVISTVTITGNEVADQQGFFNVEYTIPASLYTNADGSIKDNVVYKLTAHGAMCPGLYFIRLMKKMPYSSKSTYKFVAAEWAITGDSYRVAQSKISYDAATNYITVKATGNNNVALNFDTGKYGQKYTVDAQDKYFVIQGTNLSTAAGMSYLWWLNGANHGSQVAPTRTVTLTNGDVLLAWDITASGINDNCQGSTYKFSQGNTIFGLTSTTGTSVIKNISFVHDVEEYITTGISRIGTSDALSTSSASYNLSGQKVKDANTNSHPEVVVKQGKKYVR